MNKQIENRKDALKAANINMNQFFSITFNEGLKPGTKLTVSSGGNSASCTASSLQSGAKYSSG